jgi:putative ABC transport system ATP-binding protein
MSALFPAGATNTAGGTFPAAAAPASNPPFAIAAATAAPPPVISLRGVGRVYDTGRLQVTALHTIDLDVYPGEFVAIVGPSGSGKSTLMNIIGCLDRPTSGTYVLAGTDVAELDDDGLARLRSRSIGFVFQSYNLLARATAYKNVELPLIYAGVSRRERRSRVERALASVGLGDRAHHHPNQLSGGQQQRVAIARAVVTSPSVLLADEPTGNLDSASAEDVLTLFEGLHEEGTTIVMVTHSHEVGKRAARILLVADGLLAGDTREPVA